MNKSRYFVLALLLFASMLVKSQDVTISGIQLTPFNITAETMLSATILNSGTNNVTVVTKTELYGSDNQLLLTVKSHPFVVVPGVNLSLTSSRKAQAVEYTHTGASVYLKNTRNLPSGNFRVCVYLQATQNSEAKDEYCDEIESNINEYLYLVSPSDKDSMEIKNPMLIWSHSEPFNVLAKGESFRMVVTEIKGNQTPEEAINMNVPVMTKNNLLTHNLQYPYEARGLEGGKHYAWQVSKVSNGTIIAQTEVWEFSIIKKRTLVAKYTHLRKELDADFYEVENDKIYFISEDRYSIGSWSCKIYDTGRNEYNLKQISKETRQSSTESRETNSYLKYLGNDQFEVDVERLKLKGGFYTLEIINEYGELFLLKFRIEK